MNSVHALKRIQSTGPIAKENHTLAAIFLYPQPNSQETGVAPFILALWRPCTLMYAIIIIIIIRVHWPPVSADQPVQWRTARSRAVASVQRARLSWHQLRWTTTACHQLPAAYTCVLAWTASALMWDSTPGILTASHCYLMKCEALRQVCLFFCLLAHNSKISQPILTNFLCMLSVAVAQSSYGGPATCYVFPFYG